MAIKSEISWRRVDANGEKVEINARRFGGEWRFQHRGGRHDIWQPIPDPPLEDWQSLLEALERRMARRLVTPHEIERVRRAMRERYPEGAQE